MELFGSDFAPPQVISEAEEGAPRTGMSGRRVRYVTNGSGTSVHGLLYFKPSRTSPKGLLVSLSHRTRRHGPSLVPAQPRGRRGSRSRPTTSVKKIKASSCNFRPDRAAALVKSSRAVGLPGEILLRRSPSPSNLFRTPLVRLFRGRDAPSQDLPLPRRLVCCWQLWQRFFRFLGLNNLPVPLCPPPASCWCGGSRREQGHESHSWDFRLAAFPRDRLSYHTSTPSILFANPRKLPKRHLDVGPKAAESPQQQGFIAARRSSPVMFHHQRGFAAPRSKPNQNSLLFPAPDTFNPLTTPFFFFPLTKF